MEVKRMVVELIGGPLDGAIINGPSNLPAYLMVSGHQEGPVYRQVLTCRNSRGTHHIAYFFLGYEQTINYEFPEKSKAVQAIRQEDATIPTTEATA
jgi:hypothetical protein